MASYANFINAEVQSHYANETYVNSLDKYSSLKLKFLPSNFFFLIFGVKPKKKKKKVMRTAWQVCKVVFFQPGEFYSCIVDIYIFFCCCCCCWQVHDSSWRRAGGWGTRATSSRQPIKTPAAVMSAIDDCLALLQGNELESSLRREKIWIFMKLCSCLWWLKKFLIFK